MQGRLEPEDCRRGPRGEAGHHRRPQAGWRAPL